MNARNHDINIASFKLLITLPSTLQKKFLPDNPTTYISHTHPSNRPQPAHGGHLGPLSMLPYTVTLVNFVLDVSSGTGKNIYAGVFNLNQARNFSTSDALMFNLPAREYLKPPSLDSYHICNNSQFPKP